MVWVQAVAKDTADAQFAPCHGVIARDMGDLITVYYGRTARLADIVSGFAAAGLFGHDVRDGGLRFDSGVVGANG